MRRKTDISLLKPFLIGVEEGEESTGNIELEGEKAVVGEVGFEETRVVGDVGDEEVRVVLGEIGDEEAIGSVDTVDMTREISTLIWLFVSLLQSFSFSIS